MARITQFQAGRFVLKKSLKYSIFIGIVGEMQTGKSTFVHWLADEIVRIKNKINPINWKEKTWNFKKYCATSFEQFIDIVDNHDHAVIVIEEAGFELGNMDFHTLVSKLFNKLLQTQAYKRVILCAVLPSAFQFGKAHRHMLNFMFVAKRKVEHYRYAEIRPQFIRRTYWKIRDDRPHQVFLNIMRFTYTKEQLERAKVFTETSSF